MPNMSYCIFENTYADLRQCLHALNDDKELSESETKYKNWLVKLCREIADDYGDSD